MHLRELQQLLLHVPFTWFFLKSETQKDAQGVGYSSNGTVETKR